MSPGVAGLAFIPSKFLIAFSDRVHVLTMLNPNSDWRICTGTACVLLV